MRYLLTVLMATAVLLLSGCSYFFGNEGKFRERALDYKQAESIPPLQVPENLSGDAVKQRYPIPSVPAGDHYSPDEGDSVPRPQSLLNVNDDAGIQLRQDEDVVWLEIKRPVSVVWSTVQDFLQANAFSIDVLDTASGQIETGWLKPRRLESDKGFWKSIGRFFTGGDDDMRERFRFQVTQADSSETTIVRINHTKLSSPLPTTVQWRARNENAELVKLVYSEFIDFIVEDGAQAGSSVLSQNLKSLPKYTMTWDGNGYPILVINQDFNHAWLSIGQALARANVRVSDLNRSLGIYYLEQQAEVTDEDGDKELKDLQVRLARSESGVQVSIQLDDETVASKETSASILNRVREKLE